MAAEQIETIQITHTMAAAIVSDVINKHDEVEELDDTVISKERLCEALKYLGLEIDVDSIHTSPNGHTLPVSGQLSTLVDDMSYYAQDGITHHVLNKDAARALAQYDGNPKASSSEWGIKGVLGRLLKENIESQSVKFNGRNGYILFLDKKYIDRLETLEAKSAAAVSTSVPEHKTGSKDEHVSVKAPAWEQYKLDNADIEKLRQLSFDPPKDIAALLRKLGIIDINDYVKNESDHCMLIIGEDEISKLKQLVERAQAAQDSSEAAPSVSAASPSLQLLQRNIRLQMQPQPHHLLTQLPSIHHLRLTPSIPSILIREKQEIWPSLLIK